MKNKTNKAITQKELVNELNKLGLTEITERRVIDWREKSLLPNFDITGHGFGKGKGRSLSKWKNGRLIIEQCVWIYRLLGIYRYTGEIYLPLWMLGYSIPIEFVRNALLEPLEHFRRIFETEALETLEKVESYERKSGISEDYIGDLVFNWIRKDKFPEIFGIPQEIVEVPMNIFFNPYYQLDDVGFEDGVTFLSEWKENVDKNIMPVLSEGLNDISETNRQPIQPSGIELLFNNATFFQENLSVSQLHKFVSEATEEDFREVQTDMKVVREIIKGIGSSLEILMKDVFADSKPSLEEILPPLLTIGNLVVLTDISMRKNGMGGQINNARSEILRKVQEDFSKEALKKLEEERPNYAEAFEKGLQTLLKNFEKLLVVEQTLVT